MKLKYFIEKQRNKKLEISYYWQCKPSVAEKYHVEKLIPLGKNKEKAIEKWKQIYEKLESNKKKIKNGDFIDSQVQEGTLEHISMLYLQDRKFLRLSERTKKNYKYTINRLNNSIIVAGQKEPFKTLKVSKINRLFCKILYEKLLSKGNRAAEDFIKVLSNIMSTAIDYGYFLDENPCFRMKIEKNKPRDFVWSFEEFENFCNSALKNNDIGLYIAINIAYYTAQRLTDILNLKWSQISTDFNYIKIQQSKTGAIVQIPLYKMEKLKEILINFKSASKVEYIVFDKIDKKPYNKRTRLFGNRFEKNRMLSQIRSELTFRDLRRTAILALDEAGCTPSEISSISGHSRHSIIAMLDIYAPKTKEKAENAIEKLKLYTKKLDISIKKVGQISSCSISSTA